MNTAVRHVQKQTAFSLMKQELYIVIVIDVSVALISIKKVWFNYDYDVVSSSFRDEIAETNNTISPKLLVHFISLNKSK